MKKIAADHQVGGSVCHSKNRFFDINLFAISRRGDTVVFFKQVIEVRGGFVS